MTFNTSLRLTTPLVVFTLLAMRNIAFGFGARRNYHSYHHISQSSDGQPKSTSQPEPSSLQEETERLLERAAHIREISAQFAETLCIKRREASYVKN